MQIDVASSDDIAALYVTYLALVNAGRDEVLDITFAPGVYGVASIGPIALDLGGDPGPATPAIDVILRGAAGETPTVFRDLGMLIRARSVRLERLIMTGRTQRVLEARVARSFVMKACVVAGNEWAAPWGGALLQVSGTYDRPAYTVEIEDSWFVHNTEQSAAALLAVTPATGSFVEAVTLRRVTLVDNAMHSDLLVHEARTIDADDLFVVKRRRGAAVMLRYARAGRVVLENSTFVIDEPATLAAEDTQTWSSGLELRGSVIYTAGHANGAPYKLPIGVRGQPELRDGSRLALDATFGDTVAALTRRIPDAAARARLREALAA